MNATSSPAARLAAHAAKRVLDEAPVVGTYPLLLQVGEGAVAEQAGATLRHLLGCDVRIVFASVARRNLPPVPDAAASDRHVNVVADIVRPSPSLVVRVSESGGTVYIAAREPGTDPLGPPEGGWRWVLQSP